MEQSDWIPLLSGLVGVLIGSITSIATISLQAYFQNKRENTRMAIELATQHFKSALEFAKSHTGRSALMPLSSFVCYNIKLVDLALSKKMTPESITKLNEEMAKIDEVFEKQT